MNEQSINRICLIHQLEGLAVDLSTTNGQQNQYVCSRCLSEKFFSNQSIKWLDEAEEIFKEMQTQEFNNKKKQYEQRLESCQALKTQIQNYQQILVNHLDKLINLIQQKEEELINQLKSQTEPSKEDFQKDMKIDESENQDNEQENNFYQIIKEQIVLFKPEEQWNEILKQIEEILNQQQSKSEQVKQIFKEEEQKKIIYLPHICKAHGYQFILVTLEQKQIDERLLCPQCIQDSEYKLTSLMTLNQMWIDHQVKQYNSFLSFHTERQETVIQATNIFQNLQEKLQLICNDILQLLNQSNKRTQNEIALLNNFKIEKNIEKLELSELRKIVNNLSQKDQMEQVQLSLKQTQEQDKIFYNEITQKGQLIEQNHIQSSLQYKKIFHKTYIDQDFMKQLKMQGLRDYLKEKAISYELFNFGTILIKSELQNLFETWKQLVDQAKEFFQESKNPIQGENNQSSINQFQKQLQEEEKKMLSLTKTHDLNSSSSQTDKLLTTSLNFFSLKHQIIHQKPLQIQKSIVIQYYQLQKKSPNLSNNSKLINLQQQIILSNTVFKFSKEFKDETVIISANCQSAAIKKKRCICFCDQLIPKKGVYEINFRAKTEKIFVGICIEELIQNFTLLDHCKAGSGQYLLAFDGNVFANYNWNESFNYKKISDLQFSKNDIISVEVNQNDKKITWKIKEKNKPFTLDIKNDQDLYFAVFSWEENQEIQIV